VKRNTNLGAILAGAKPDKEQFMRKLVLEKIACMVAVFCVAAAVASSAQTFTTLVKFNGTPQPANPSQLLAGIDGNIYGVTQAGGTNGTSSTGGTFFRMTPAGKVSVLYSFCALANCADGTNPNSLIQTANGKFYGTTADGGASDASICSNVGTGCGTFFEIGPGHPLTTLYSFCSQTNCNDGFEPWGAPLAVGRNGNIYGTTRNGGDLNGDNNCAWGCGTIFDITPTGTLTTLHVFCSTESCPEGSEGNGLTLFSDGNFYGATLDSLSGNFGGGLYRMSPSGDLTVLFSFDPEGPGGDEPTPPIEATDGFIYGTVFYGGKNDGAGYFYKKSPEGKLTPLYDFCSLPNCADGAGPNQVIQGSDGNFYGTTVAGGSASPNCPENGCGTLFQITPTGTLTTLHSFCSEKDCADGSSPHGALIQATSGIFYGAVPYGGGSSNCGSGCGTIFSLSVSPSVEANRNSESSGQ
jgi:uncharacterized repeat protein (TIGR03803 family)